MSLLQIISQGAGLYASFLKGLGRQSIFCLVKGTLWGNCKFLLEEFQGHQGNDQGTWKQTAFFANVKYHAWRVGSNGYSLVAPSPPAPLDAPPPHLIPLVILQRIIWITWPWISFEKPLPNPCTWRKQWHWCLRCVIRDRLISSSTSASECTKHTMVASG